MVQWFMNKIFKYLKQLIKKISEDEMFLRASGVSFYILLAFFPFVLIVFLLSTFISNRVSEAIFDILNLLPQDIEAIVSQLLTDTQASGILIISLVGVSVWTLSGALVTISKSLNVFYNVKETRNFIVNRLSAIMWAVMMLVLIIAIMVLIVFENYITLFLSVNFNLKPAGVLYDAFGLVLLFATLTLILALIYKFVPNKKIKFTSVIKGSLTAALMWGVSSYGLAIYVNYFPTYHILYGSIAGILVLITWIFLTSTVLLLGGEINSISKNKADTDCN